MPALGLGLALTFGGYGNNSMPSILALNVVTSTTTIPAPGAANGYQVSQPFNTAGGAFTMNMPNPLVLPPKRGMRVTIENEDTTGAIAVNPLTVADLNDYQIQDPQTFQLYAPGTPFVNRLLGSITWEFMDNNTWMVVA